MEAVGVANKAAPISFGIAVVLGLVFMVTGAKGWGTVSLLVGCALFMIVKMVARIIHPR